MSNLSTPNPWGARGRENSDDRKTRVPHGLRGGDDWPLRLGVNGFTCDAILTEVRNQKITTDLKFNPANLGVSHAVPRT